MQSHIRAPIRTVINKNKKQAKTTKQTKTKNMITDKPQFLFLKTISMKVNIPPYKT